MSYLQNVSVLLKDELIWEVSVRGASPVGDVVSLRKQLRDLVASGGGVEWPEEMGPEEELVACRRKIEEWEGTLDDLQSEVPSGRERSRIMGRLGHLVARLKQLNGCTDLKASERSWVLESLSFLEQVLERVAGVVTPTTLRPPFFDTAGVSAARGPPAGGPQASGAGPHPSDGRVGGGVVPSMAGLSVGDMGHGPNFGPVNLTYHKLPNPLAPLVQGLTVLDGLDPEELYRFLGTFLRLGDLPGVGGADMLRLLVPVCRGPLGDVLSDVLLRGGCVDDFHREAIEFFLPGRIKERLTMQKFYRPQGRDESLAVYFSSIREARRILRLPLSEADTVLSIVEGIAPADRARLVFAGRPSSFADLHRLCITSNSVRYSDQQREELAPRVVPPRVSSSAAGSGRPVRDGVSRGPTCFGCGRVGHVRRDCPQNRPRGSEN